jgi:hypothetical protein
MLRGWIPAAGPLWPGTWHESAAEMLRKDLAAARATWLLEAPNEAERTKREKTTYLCPTDKAGRVFDFHALRGQFITGLARSEYTQRPRKNWPATRR